MLIGAINWAGVIPNAHDTGVRNDRCSFGWGMGDALKNFGTSFGVPTKDKARGNGYFPACDGLGAVPPFPCGTLALEPSLPPSHLSSSLLLSPCR